MDFFKFIQQWFEPDLDKLLATFNTTLAKLETLISHHTKATAAFTQAAAKATATAASYNAAALKATAIKNNIKKLIEEN